MKSQKGCIKFMANFSIRLAFVIRQFLEDDDWKYSFDQDKGVFKFNLTLATRIKSVQYHVIVHEDDYTVYATSPLNVDKDEPETMANMAEFLHRANYGLRNGNFEMDFRDGEVRYKCFVNCDGQLPTTQIIKDSIYIPAAMFKRYAPGIVEVMFGINSPKAAIDKCENN